MTSEQQQQLQGDIRLEWWSGDTKWEHATIEYHNDDWYLWGAIHLPVRIIRAWKWKLVDDDDDDDDDDKEKNE